MGDGGGCGGGGGGCGCACGSGGGAGKDSPEKAQASGFILASILAGYPEERFGFHVDSIRHNPGVAGWCAAAGEAAWGRINGHLDRITDRTQGDAADLDALRSDYIDVFDRGRQSNPLYESEYGKERAMAKGGQLADIAGFYRAFGLEIDTEGPGRELVDHVSVQLEFYGLLLLKYAHLRAKEDAEGVDIVLTARRKFMDDHLGRFVGSIAERPGVLEHGFYRDVFAWIRDLVAAECERLGVAPQPATWLASDSRRDDEISCCAPGLSPAAHN